jgi:Kef-type K+ transport system membrane component KefB
MTGWTGWQCELILAAALRGEVGLGTVTVVLAVGMRLAARTGFSSIPIYLIAGIVLGALARPTLDRRKQAPLQSRGNGAGASVGTSSGRKLRKR